MMALEWNFSQV